MGELVFDLIYTIDSFITGILKVVAIVFILTILKNKKGAIKCLPK